MYRLLIPAILLPTLFSYSQPPDLFNTGEILPIKPERTISFSTNEGSYLDVDVSPDGQTLLFQLLGDFYTMPITGGKANQNTRGLAMKRHPVWSPDGKFIAYSSDGSGKRQLEITSVAGDFHRVLGDAPSRICWMPEGNQVIGSRVIHHISGAGVIPLSGLLADKIFGFSNSGRYAYRIAEDSLTNSNCVKRHDRQSNRDTIVFSSNQRDFVNPRVSRDGRWLTFMQSDSVNRFLLHFVAFDVHQQTSRTLKTFSLATSRTIANQQYAIAPNNRSLFIGYEGKIHCIELSSGEDNVIPFTADVRVDMGKLNYNQFKLPHDSLKVQYIRAAQLSPDGKQMIFCALGRMYLIDMGTGAKRVLVKQSFNQFQPSFSHDGQWIAYVGWDDEEEGHVWRVKVNGGNPERITRSAGYYIHPTWAPDGKSILVTKRGEGQHGMRDCPGSWGQLFRYGIDGDERLLMEEPVSLEHRPEFSADGNYIHYQPRLGMGEAVPFLCKVSLDDTVKMTLATANTMDHERVSLTGGDFQQVSLSPDGKHMVYWYRDNLHLVTMTNIGHPTSVFDLGNTIGVIRFAEGGNDFQWRDGGESIFWSYGNQYHQVRVEKILEAATTWDKSMLDESGIIKATVVPDFSGFFDLYVPHGRANGLIAFKNARLITMRGDEVIEKGTIVIQDGRIFSMGDAGAIKIPAKAKVFDMDGKTIMPGIIDMHPHMRGAVPPYIHHQQHWEFLVNLAYGVTTARDPSGSPDTYGYAELIESGKMIGPRLITTGTAVRKWAFVTHQAEANAIVANRAKLGGLDVKQYLQPNRGQRQWLLEASKKAGVNMTNEAGFDIPDYIGMFRDGSTGVEHNNRNWGDIRTDVIKLIAKSSTYLTPTLQVMQPLAMGKSGLGYFHPKYLSEPDEKLFRFVPNSALAYWMKIGQDAERAGMFYATDLTFVHDSKINCEIVREGGLITLGSHGEAQGIGAHFEIWALQMGGVTNHEALQIATINGAKAMGLQQDLGSLEPGKVADLIILDKNPLEDIQHSREIGYVMKNGVLYDGQTMDTVWPYRRKLPAIYDYTKTYDE